MKTSVTSYFLAACASLMLVACSDKQNDPAPDPTPDLTLSSYFDFTTVTPAGGVAHHGYGTGHSSLAIKGEGAMNAQILALDFAAGTDAVHLEVERAALGSTWTGTYALRSRNQQTAPVFVSYIYRGASGGSSIYRFSDTTNDLIGDVTITAYDARRQLVSGRFAVEAPRQLDPNAGFSPDAPKCAIILQGDFKNLKIKVR
ncbi:hypothetical protein KLP40_02560 [Hymenobacter sp. NST-14]|uniref:hypothetical protein n=1 Tax=Hymenobacter piscis TaxID=2839984 RepID=UPI001C030A2E|nr:hypothetical protein [Hymenobacter piscis]MBT9392035.1 hypothetical protein [Hymenobacter piscis]